MQSSPLAIPGGLRSALVLAALLLATLLSAHAVAANEFGDVRLENDPLRVTMEDERLSLHVLHKATGRTWRLAGESERSVVSRPYDYVQAEFYPVPGELVLVRTEGDSPPEAHGFAFARAAREFVVEPGQVDIKLSWAAPEAEAAEAAGEGPIRLHLRLSLDREAPELIAEVIGLETPDGYRLVELLFPGGLLSAEDEPGDLVWPLASGAVLRLQDHGALRIRLAAHSRLLYMPWIGFTAGPDAALMILETPADGAIDLHYEQRGPSMAAAVWRSSLGELGERRRVRFSFLGDAGHVELAKRYRESVIDRGDLVPLQHKLERTPAARNFAGGVLLRMQGLWIQPETGHRMLKNTFADMEAMLRAAHGRGIRNLVLHTDGWGSDGYDRLHPQPLPPNAESGGWDGLRSLARKVRELDYLMILHDNYLMYHLDSPAFDWEKAVHTFQGERPFTTTWGAPQSILSERYALPHLRANLDGLEAAGVEIGGMYLDEYGVVELNESHHADAPLRRAQSLHYRREMFQELANRGLVATTEEPVDWVVPSIVAPFWARLPPWMEWEWIADPTAHAPLLHLVYGDSMVIPRAVDSEVNVLTALLYGEIPNIAMYGPTADEPVGFHSDDTAGVAKRVADSQAAVAGVEMVDHRYLNEARTLQETRFANGTSVRVDFEALTVVRE